MYNKRKSHVAAREYDSKRQRYNQFENVHNETNSLVSKIERFVNIVTSEEPWGKIVLGVTQDEHPFVSLQNSLIVFDDRYKPQITRNSSTSEFELSCNGYLLARKNCENLKVAKIALGWLALDELHQKCFIIMRKNNYIQISNEDIQNSSKSKPWEESSEKQSGESGDKQSTSSEGPMAGSLAYKMMQKMGWSGGGLGASEQGITENIIVTENIERKGLGHDNVPKKLQNMLYEYSKSNKITALAFSKEFSKSEREIIHKMCARLKLKSKSVGQGEDRYITVTRKMTRLDMVRELLKCDLENEFYKLIIPEKHVALYESIFGKPVPQSETNEGNEDD